MSNSMSNSMSLSKISQLAEWFKNDQLPLLFIEQNGKSRVWACWVTNNSVYRTDGFVTGKLKEPLAHEYLGNTQKTGEEQAQAEAEKLWIKQVSAGYKPASADTKGMEIWSFVMEQKSQNGGMNRGVKMFGNTQITCKTTSGKVNLANGKLPMLAKKYYENGEITSVGKNIKFPVMCQPKVDGVRVLAQIIDGQVSLQSRNKNEYMHLEHIRKEIAVFLKGNENVILDGELYVHKLYKTSGKPTTKKTSTELKGVERYQFISEACKVTRTTKHEYETFVEYWVFDIYDLEKTNKQRFEQLEKLFKNYKGTIIKQVPTQMLKSHSEIEEFMSEMIGENNGRNGYEFEGIMIRDPNAKYKNSKTHSSCLLKWKRFDDEEWKIVGADKCVGGAQDGKIKWICKKKINGIEKQIAATQNGSAEEGKQMYLDYKKNPNDYIGKWINIRFNDKTADGIPRFPRATAIVQDKF